MTTCILHLKPCMSLPSCETDFQILSQRRAVTWIPLPTTQCARSHGACPPAIKSALSRRATQLETKVGSELAPAVRQVPDFAAEAGSPSSRVTDTPVVAAFNQ